MPEAETGGSPCAGSVRERRVELPVAKEVADGLGGLKALSSGTLGMSLGISRTIGWRLLREQRGRPHKRVPVPCLAAPQMATRLRFCRVMLQRLKGSTHRIFWQASTPGASLLTCSSQTRSCFGSGTAGNSQNDRVRSSCPKKRDDPVTGFGDASQPEATSREGQGRRRSTRWRPVPARLHPSGVKMCSDEYHELLLRTTRPVMCPTKASLGLRSRQSTCWGGRPRHQDRNPLDHSVWSTTRGPCPALSITCDGSLSGLSMNSHRQTQVVSLGST